MTERSAPSPDLSLALDAARQAGALIADRFSKAVVAERKSGEGEVTQTDRDAETIILDILGSGSAYAILSEEAGGARDSDAGLWVVDPLDGTTNLSRGIPLCAALGVETAHDRADVRFEKPGTHDDQDQTQIKRELPGARPGEVAGRIDDTAHKNRLALADHPVRDPPTR